MDYGVACCFNWNFYDGFDWWGVGGDDLVCWGMVAWCGWVGVVRVAAASVSSSAFWKVVVSLNL